MKRPSTLGALKKSGYASKSIKDELRDNLIEKLKKKETVFEGIGVNMGGILAHRKTCIGRKIRISRLVFSRLAFHQQSGATTSPTW